MLHSNNREDERTRQQRYLERIGDLQRKIDLTRKKILVEEKKELEIDQLKKVLKDRELGIKNLSLKCKKSKRRLDKLTNSKSWRYTLPLRIIGKNIKLIIRFFKGEKKSVNVDSQAQSQMTLSIKSGRTQIKRIKYSLYSLGFINKGLENLQLLYEQNNDKHMKKLIAWELALWYVNLNTEDGAKQGLEYLSVVLQYEKDQGALRKIAILQAESFEKLGNQEDAKDVISKAIERDAHVDLYFAAANLEKNLPDKIKWINEALNAYNISSILYKESYSSVNYDCLDNQVDNKILNPLDYLLIMPKVSVIIPVYNSQTYIETALNSVLKQTWSNLEVLVVDDCSTDNTVQMVEAYKKIDSRIKLIRAHENGGPYIARNLGLSEATGEFVTCHDADDWSHPEKIEKQVMQLLENSSTMGNTSEMARVFEDLTFYRRGNPGFYTQKNMSSFMFRRAPVIEKIGYWDSVRFAGDSEFIKRFLKVFGEESIVNIAGPLSFPRQTEDSLISNGAFGYSGHKMGVRMEYTEAFEYYHDNSDNLFMPFPHTGRLFPIPEPMLSQGSNERRHFDVILASEFRLPGGTTTSNVEEITAQKELGLKTGLIHLSRYYARTNMPINPKIRDLIDGDQVQMLAYGEKVTCDLLIVRFPPSLQEWQKYIPDVKAKNICVIVNQTPKRDYGENGQVVYDIQQCEKNLKEYFGKSGIWYPIGPSIREALIRYHAEDLQSIRFSEEDWTNIINVQEWHRESRPQKSSVIKIGRHSRDADVKWPAERDELLKVYPDSTEFEVNILGGAAFPEKILGYIPENWHVMKFGELPPQDFLADLDVFVYFIHPDSIEAFGRTIFEAMAVGVPAIVPHRFEKLFHEAAIYAEPHEVRDEIRRLMSDDDYYLGQVEKALQYVESKFGYTQHALRISRKDVRLRHNALQV